MTKMHRRNALKGLVFTVPTAWSAPLVKSVVLPVHAQTTETCIGEDTLTDFIIDCSQLPGEGEVVQVTDHVFSICDGELRLQKLVSEPVSSPGGPSESGILRVIARFDANTPQVGLSAYADGFIGGALQPCSDPVDLGAVQEQGPIFIDGQEFTVMLTVSRSGSNASVSITNISVTQ